MAYPVRHEERKTAYAGVSTRLLSVVFFVASSTTSWAQHPADPLKTFTAPNGSLSFRYASQLIQCQQNKQADGGYSWIPTENCAA
jgi:hypothetical protein